MVTHRLVQFNNKSYGVQRVHTILGIPFYRSYCASLGVKCFFDEEQFIQEWCQMTKEEAKDKLAELGKAGEPIYGMVYPIKVIKDEES